MLRIVIIERIIEQIFMVFNVVKFMFITIFNLEIIIPKLMTFGRSWPKIEGKKSQSVSIGTIFELAKLGKEIKVINWIILFSSIIFSPLIMHLFTIPRVVIETSKTCLLLYVKLQATIVRKTFMFCRQIKQCINFHNWIAVLHLVWGHIRFSMQVLNGVNDI